MAIQALIIAIVTWLIGGLESWLAYPMINCPLVLCPIVGAICGDLKTGIVMGATMQLVFLGVMGIGGTLPQAADLGSIVGTALAIWQGASVEVALAFAVPVSLLGSTLAFLSFFIRTLFTPLTAKLVAKGDMKGLEIEQVCLAWLPCLPTYILVFTVLAFGNGIAETLINSLPQTLIDGLDYATGLMPAVGIALLMKAMWNKRIAIFFFIGALLATYFGQGTLVAALVGTIIAVIDMKIQNMNVTKTSVATDTNDGGLFND